MFVFHMNKIQPQQKQVFAIRLKITAPFIQKVIIVTLLLLTSIRLIPLQLPAFPYESPDL